MQCSEIVCSIVWRLAATSTVDHFLSYSMNVIVVVGLLIIKFALPALLVILRHVMCRLATEKAKVAECG